MTRRFVDVLVITFSYSCVRFNEQCSVSFAIPAAILAARTDVQHVTQDFFQDSMIKNYIDLDVICSKRSTLDN